MKHAITSELWELFDKVSVALINGLINDGVHHKQYYLYQALRELGGDKFAEAAKEEFIFDEGIAP